MLSIALALSALAFPSPQEIPADPFVRVELANGVRAAILHVEGAERQSFLTFLPRGLYHDGAHRAQFSHLLEHMLIRSTDPDALRVEGIEMNGETMGGSLRLDAYAEPDAWREALVRHRRWITAAAFDEEVLAREKERIAAELENTIPHGYTHKWAAAAWSQIAGHGLEHAAVRGDVEGATVAQVAAYADERVRIGGDVLIVAAGPVPVEEVVRALEEEYAALEARPRAKTAGLATKSLKKGNLEATWDLDARHYVEWYPLPDGGPLDRVAALALAQRLSQVLFTSEDPLVTGGKALTAYDLDTPAGRALTISVSLGAKTDVKEVRAALRTALDGLLESNRRLPDVEGTILQMRMQLGRLPAFDYLRKQLAGRGGSALIEAQIALTLANQELQLGMTSPELHRTLEELEPEHVEAIAKKHLAAKNRSSLLLEPRAEGR